MNPLDQHIVIIGGGAAGLSTAYHLAKLGCSNVLLLERNQLTSGTSWHAAGIVGPLRASQNLTTLAKYALELFPKLEQETGQATGYKQTGGLWLTAEQDRLIELKRIAAMGQMNELNGVFLTPGELKERFEMINVSDLAGAMWLDQDGQVNPVDMCMALAKGARMHGVEIREHAGVSSIEVAAGRAQSVTLDNGETIDCDVIVNCAGLWARHIGLLAGVSLPLHAVEHMYVVSEPIPEMPLPWPVIRDMEAALYIKEDVGKLVLGVFEPNAKLWDHTSVATDNSFLVFEEDWDHIEPMMHAGINRIPRFESLGLTHFMTGPESFTPDTKQLMGACPELPNFYVAAGFNSLGIMSAPGVGKAMADWITKSRSPIDLWEVDVARFLSEDNDLKFLHQRIPEAVSNQFDMHWPNKQYKTGRNRKLTVWHEKMRQLGAVFGAVAGWERPLWFAKDHEPDELVYSYGDQNWWPVARRESLALMQTGALFELSPFTKIEIKGADAVAVLNRLCTAEIDVEIGRVVYTLMLNEDGGIECELTVTRINEQEFLLVTASSTRRRDIAWINRIAQDNDVEVSDITEDYCVLGIMGPNSRALLSALGVNHIAVDEFSFAHSRIENIDNAEIRLSRLSFVGESGWEMMIANQDANRLLDKIVAEANKLKMVMAGLLTMECCRLEKGYLHWGHDMGPEENPFQAGLGFACKTTKQTEFIGKQALEVIQHEALNKKLTLFRAKDSRPLLLHDEPLFYQQQWVGRTTSGGIGFRIHQQDQNVSTQHNGIALCFGYLDTTIIGEQISGLEFEVQVQGEMHTLLAYDKPPYDPSGSRMRVG